MASHWNLKGEADGYIQKFWGLFLTPLILVGIFLLYLFIPKIDPLKKNLEKFKIYFDGFIILIAAFLFYLYFLTIFWNLGLKLNIAKSLAPALSFLFYYSGIMLKKTKRNWFVGIRTPWTLSNDKVWDKTHRIGSKLFKATALIILLGIFFEKYLLFFVLIPLLITVVIVVVYSYFEYKKEEKGNQNNF